MDGLIIGTEYPVAIMAIKVPGINGPGGTLGREVGNTHGHVAIRGKFERSDNWLAVIT